MPKLVTSLIIKFWKPDYLWITHPDMFKVIPSSSRVPVIYDCMDNYKEMVPDIKLKQHIVSEEKEIINAATTVLCSSDYLAEEISKNYSYDRNNISVIRNGYN